MKDTNNVLMKFISTQGYKNSSPDVNNPINVIPSNRITMKDVDFPVQGVDNLGNSQLMMPGGEYLFGGDYVIETPMKKQGGEKDADIKCGNCGWSWKVSNGGSDPYTCHKCGAENAEVQMKNGGQHGGLDRWFAEKWVDVKTGKPCGRQKGEKRDGYPACRPSKRISSETPKTASELSQSEKDKFKRSKTSSKRIDYNHKKNEFGGQNIFEKNFTMEDYNKLEMMAKGGNVPTNPALWSRAKAAAKAKYDVYPSAYANGFASKWYKSKGGGWRKAEFGMEVMGDGGTPNNAGFNALPDYVQQKIMNNMAEGGEKMPADIARARFAAAGNLDQMDEYGYAFGGYVPEMMYGGDYEMKNGGCMECGGQMQEGGEQPQQEQGSNINDALGEISMMLENGTNPNDILQMLIEQGVPEEQGMEIIQSAQNDVVESDLEEEDVPVDSEDIEDDSEELLSSEDEMKYGGIKLDPKKKGTFKAQATKMGMSVQEAAEHILDNKEEYSPEMVKKANFARNFAKELGGQMYEMASGGTVPDRYKNMGFSKVGVKKQSTRPGKKWMVLAKKGDQYKVVHGGWKGMKDFTQHGSEKRKDRFWDRMGGRDSAKAKDPFSPLYWHKRFGTWQDGGESTSMYDYENYKVGDQRTNKTESNTISSLENNAWNRGLATANTLGDPRSMIWALPNKGILGTVKGIAGAAAGLSGAILGYEKLFSKPKTTEYVVNNDTKESGKLSDVLAKRKEDQDKLMKQYSQPSMYQEAPKDEMNRKQNMLPADPMMQPWMNDGTIPNNPNVGMMAKYGGAMQEYQVGGQSKPLTYDEWLAENNRGLMGEEGRDMNDYQQYLSSFQPAVATSVGGTEVAQTPGGAAQPTDKSDVAKQSTQTFKGDNVGVIAANNALAGLGMVNEVLGAGDYEKEYNQRLREMGNTMNRYNPQNAVNPFGNYTVNAGPASNFALVANTPIQDFGTKMSSAKYGGLIPFIPATRQYEEGGEFYADEDEIKRILAMGGEIEYLD
jgi:hypothetical protein